MLAAFARNAVSSIARSAANGSASAAPIASGNVFSFTQFARGLASADAGLTTGTVKWFNVEKGFGFIQPADGSADVFVHQTVIHSEGFRSLDVGEDVEFRIEDDNGRARAVDVTGPQGSFVKGAPRNDSRY